METFIYCTEDEIREYLQRFSAGRDSHDYELSEGVRLKRYFDFQLKRPHLVGIPVLPDGKKKLDSGEISKYEAIRDYRSENNDVDILILDAEDSHATPRDTPRGQVFQIKRFTDYQFDGDFTSSVIEILKKILKKGYAPTVYLSLYIAINVGPQIHTPDWEKIERFLVNEKVPFNRVMIGPIVNEKAEELLVELFPKLRFLKA